jgi:hypothetical protein
MLTAAIAIIWLCLLYEVGILLISAGILVLCMTKQDKKLCRSSDYELDVYCRKHFGKCFTTANLVGLGVLVTFGWWKGLFL